MSAVSYSFELHVLVILGIFILGVGISSYLALPERLRTRSIGRAYRLDGSHSSRREAIESRRRRKFLWDAMAITALLALPVLGLGFLIHHWIVPADMAVEAISRFDTDHEQWRANLESDTTGDLRSQHKEWARSADYSQDGVQSLQATAWHAWPALLVGMLLLSLGCIWLLVQSIRRLVHEFTQSLFRREFEYDQTDREAVQNSIIEGSTTNEIAD